MAVAVLTREQEELSPRRRALVRDHLEKVLWSPAFAGSKRSQDFLKLIVGHTLEGETDALRERMIGAEMFGRPIGYDTGNDPVVRVKATEVRKKLAQYYSEAKVKDSVRIEFPSGTYVPRFHFEPQEAAMPSQPKAAALTPEQSPQAPALGEQDAQPATKAKEAITLPRRKSLGAPRVLAAGTVGLAVIAMAVFVSVKKWYIDPTAGAEIRSIAILPMENLSGDAGQDYFADGMTEELINDLGQVSTLKVISLTSAMSYKKTKKTLPEIAHELAVDGAVEGVIQREGNHVRVSARLIDAATDRPLWAHTYSRDAASVLAIQGEVAQAIAEEISMNVTPQQRARLARKHPVNAEAENLYLQGMRRLNAEDLNSSTDLLQRAIEADPNSAPAHAALADCYGWMGESSGVAYSDFFLKQRAEAIEAVELDDFLPEGHAELADAAMNLNWDWTTAAKEFQRAQQLNPNSASIHEKYAVYLAKAGKLSEAAEQIKQSLELDPVSDRSFRNAAFIYLALRQNSQALSLIGKMQSLHITPPDFLEGSVYVETGMYAKAIDAFIKSGNGPPALGHLGNAYARAGQTDAARKTILQLEELVRKSGAGRYEIALVYAGLGEKDPAFRWLENSYRAHDGGLTYLKIDSCLDPLRSDPRFDALMRRVGLAP
jgi:TolB-like protein/Flp pilus assembly protein TadD